MTPFVGVIPAYCQFRIESGGNHGGVFGADLGFIISPNFTIDDYLSPRGDPRYHFYVNGWDVWGVTARIIVQFLELVYDFQVKKV